MKNYIRALSPGLEFGIVVVGAFGLFVAGSVLAFFDPSGPVPISNGQLQSVIVYELVVAAILLTFLKIRKWTLQSFGVNASLQGTLVGVGLAAAAYLASRTSPHFNLMIPMS